MFSVDLEEFDIPEEYGQQLPLPDKLEVSYKGMQSLAALMQAYQVKSTIFSTAFWAGHHPQFIRDLAQQHEIGSHTFYHDRFREEDLAESRKVLSEIAGKEVKGLRMPLMQDIDPSVIQAAGYSYDSSLHPTWLPGRYNHLDRQRTPHLRRNLWILPASVTPVLRIPVFWLSFKNLPFRIYRNLCSKILAKDGYLVLYVHPWEFTDLSRYQLPAIIKRRDGARLLQRLEELFRFFSGQGYQYMTHYEFIANYIKSQERPV